MTPEQIRHLQRTSTSAPAPSFEGDEEVSIMFDAPPTAPVERARAAFADVSEEELDAATARVMQRVKSTMRGIHDT